MEKLYRLKIPVTVNAIKLTPENLKWVAQWCGGEVGVMDVNIKIPTLYGSMYAVDGNYVIKKRNGDFFILHSSYFEDQYELVN